jgi:hypothetical protein
MAGNFILFNKFKLWCADGTFNLSSDTFKVTLHTSSYSPLLTNSVYADLTNELSTANGYTNGGLTLTSVTWTEASGVITFTAANAVWAATGAGITARTAVIRKSGTANSHVDPLVAYCSETVDQTAPAGSNFTVQINASGIFTLSGGNT